MVLYARQDILSVAPSGGCGRSHNRPILSEDDDGEITYVPVWGINCKPCESILNDDVQWSKSRHRIPLTPDQVQELADAKEEAERTLQLEQLRKIREDAQLRAQQAAVATSDEVAGVAPVITGREDGPSGGSANSTGSTAADYGALSKTDLKDLARNRGLPVGGTREDLIARHVEHDNG